MDFYEIVTKDIVDLIRAWQDEYSGLETYNFSRFDSIDEFMNTFATHEYDNDNIIYEEHCNLRDLKDYINEFLQMEGTFYNVDYSFLKLIFNDDGTYLSYWLKQWIFNDCCDRAKEILRPEFEASQTTEVELSDEEYDEGFDESLRIKHKRRLKY